MGMDYSPCLASLSKALLVTRIFHSSPACECSISNVSMLFSFILDSSRSGGGSVAESIRMKKAAKLQEVADGADEVRAKVQELAALLRQSKLTLVYTGAGISTAANIPDYRGPNGVWTLAEMGQQPECRNIVESAPTVSHLVLKELYRRGVVKHILSQNCDGLHLRSGMPQNGLSEIHGNMHIEVCTRCDNRQYIRSFDVTEKSGFRKHKTGRNCGSCSGPLRDTIVHFGEHGKLPFPLNWRGTTKHVEDADLIICIGSSLAVLKDYPFLWPDPDATTKIAIINLQWTPKDKLAALKINARCDDVLTQLADELGIPLRHYCRDCDPVLAPRRSARVNELMAKMTDCSCHVRLPRTSVEEQKTKKAPGWWNAGLTMVAKMRSKKTNRSNSDDGAEDLNNRVKSIDRIVSEVLSDILDELDPENARPSPSSQECEEPVASSSQAKSASRTRKAPTTRPPPCGRGGSSSSESEQESSEEEVEDSEEEYRDEDEDEDEGAEEKGTSSSDDDYRPELYDQRRAQALLATGRSTRSSGNAPNHPLCLDMRKLSRSSMAKRRGSAAGAGRREEEEMGDMKRRKRSAEEDADLVMKEKRECEGEESQAKALEQPMPSSDDLASQKVDLPRSESVGDIKPLGSAVWHASEADSNQEDEPPCRAIDDATDGVKIERKKENFPSGLLFCKE